jgi:hypothetical protein
VTREFARSREGDLHLGRAFDLLRGDTLAIFQGVGSSEDLSAAIDQWERLRGDQRLNSLNHFRDKQTAHLGASDPNIPPAINKDLFALGNAVVDLVDRLAKGVGMTNVKVRDNIDAKPTAEAFWLPWKSHRHLARDRAVRPRAASVKIITFRSIADSAAQLPWKNIVKL